MPGVCPGGGGGMLKFRVARCISEDNKVVDRTLLLTRVVTRKSDPSHTSLCKEQKKETLDQATCLTRPER